MVIDPAKGVRMREFVAKNRDRRAAKLQLSPVRATFNTIPQVAFEKEVGRTWNHPYQHPLQLRRCANALVDRRPVNRRPLRAALQNYFYFEIMIVENPMQLKSGLFADVVHGMILLKDLSSDAA